MAVRRSRHRASGSMATALPWTLSLSAFGNLFWRRRRAPNTTSATRTRRRSASSFWRPVGGLLPTQYDIHLPLVAVGAAAGGQLWGRWRQHPASTRASSSSVDHTCWESPRARGAGREVSSRSGLPWWCRSVGEAARRPIKTRTRRSRRFLFSAMAAAGDHWRIEGSGKTARVALARWNRPTAW